MTATMRFGGQINSSLADIETNTVPYPRIHCMTPSIASPKPYDVDDKGAQTIEELSSSLFESSNILISTSKEAL